MFGRVFAGAAIALLMAGPALAADPSWPGNDPTWQTADPSWLQSNWRWQMSNPGGASKVPVSGYKPSMNTGYAGYRFDLQAALNSAAAHGDMVMVKQLVEQGANINVRDAEGYTALTWAAQRGQTPVAKFLLEHYAQANPADRGGYTPLMWAAQGGYADMCELLLKHGANPRVVEKRGMDAAAIARMTGNTNLSYQLQGWATAGATRITPTPIKP